MALAAIFDVDGTLLNSVDLHARAWRDALCDYGHEVGFAAIRSQIGKGGDQLLPEFLSAAEIARIGTELEAHRGRLFRQRYLDQVQPFPRVRRLFQRLLQDGVKVALATSAKADELADYRRMAGIDDLVQAEASSRDAEQSKPAPDIFAAALSRLGTMDPASVVAVGDTPYDAIAAGRAGMRTIGLLCGGWSDSELRDAGCVAIYDDPQALLAAYETSPLRNRGA